MGFVGFDHPYLIWSPHITQRIIPYINLSQRVYVFSSASLFFSLRVEDSPYDKNRSLMINITSELQIPNQEHWESDFDRIEWTGIDLSIYLRKPSYFVSGKCFNVGTIYADLNYTVCASTNDFSQEFKIQTWYHNDSQTLVHAFYPKLTKENTHSCMNRKPSKPL